MCEYLLRGDHFFQVVECFFCIVPSISNESCSLTAGSKRVPPLTGWVRICRSN